MKLYINHQNIHLIQIAGALFSLGKGQLNLSDISKALAHQKEEKISSRAKSRGLHLIQIWY